MSHFVTVKTKYRDRDALVAALRQQFPNNEIEVNDEPRPLVGWRRAAGVPCHVIVKQGAASHLYGELGFALGADGIYEQHGDTSDAAAGAYSGLEQKYAYEVIREQARVGGYTMESTVSDDGTISVSLSKW